MSESNRAISKDLEKTGREGKYLTFSLADEEYGIGILKIKEIIGYSLFVVRHSRITNNEQR